MKPTFCRPAFSAALSLVLSAAFALPAAAGAVKAEVTRTLSQEQSALDSASDRLAALTSELGALGSAITETRDGLRIAPAPLHGGRFRTFHDHRMATAGAILGLRVPGVLVEDIATTGKTFPDFPEVWTALL